MIGYLLGLGAAYLLGKKYLASKKPPQQLPSSAQQQQTVNAQQAAILDQARRAMGAKPASAATSTQSLIDRAQANLGIKRVDPHAPPHRAVLMQGDPLSTTQGRTYWVTIVLHGLAASAGRNDIIEDAQNRGFVDVIPSPARPADWPGNAQGDWYVKAKAGRSNTFPRNKGSNIAGATIVEAFEA